jgi:hypothetical protein
MAFPETQPQSFNNGILPVQNNAQIDAHKAQADSREAASKANNEPVVTGLAAHVRKCWSSAYLAKQDVEQKMLKAVRQRRGEYDPEVLMEIQKTGGSEIYMMVTSNKCRGATSWLRDSLLGSADEKPWTVSPTKLPELTPKDIEEATAIAAQEAFAVEQALGGSQVTTPQTMQETVERTKDKMLAESIKEATKKVKKMEDKMEDQLQEGGFVNELSKFLEDITTFPAAVMKGPVIRNKPTLQWIQGADGNYTADVKNKLVKEWERVDPFNIYPAPHSTDVHDGYIIERHRMTRGQLVELIGVEGYSEDAIRAVLDDYGRGGLHEWLRVDTQKAQAEGKSTLAILQNTDALIDALQYHGSVQGQMLVDWGMPKEQVPDLMKEYACEVWLIGTWVIKSTLNYDPFGRKPYYKASYEEIPGTFWGNSVADLVRDCQNVCNSAARSLVNNMGIASGPQVYVNVDRLPPGEEITQMYPWKIWPTINDPYGSNSPPVEFFQPNSLAAELMGIYERFSVLADEYSGVPRYMTGDATAGGAGRTASGLSMLMGNAGKAIKGVIANIDENVIAPIIERLYIHNMRYETDPELKGDINVVARGASGLLQKDQAQVRRNEFLGIVGQNQIFSQIVGEEGIAALLRETASTLGMDVDKIVPSEEAVRVAKAQAQQQQMLAQAAAVQQSMLPTESINFQRDADGAVTGAQVMPNTANQNLQNGAPSVNNFTPQKGV